MGDAYAACLHRSRARSFSPGAVVYPTLTSPTGTCCRSAVLLRLRRDVLGPSFIFRTTRSPPILRVSAPVLAFLMAFLFFALSNLSSYRRPPCSPGGPLRSSRSAPSWTWPVTRSFFAQFERIQQSATERELRPSRPPGRPTPALPPRNKTWSVARAHHDLKHQVEAIRASWDAPPHRLPSLSLRSSRSDNTAAMRSSTSF